MVFTAFCVVVPFKITMHVKYSNSFYQKVFALYRYRSTEIRSHLTHFSGTSADSSGLCVLQISLKNTLLTAPARIETHPNFSFR